MKKDNVCKLALKNLHGWLFCVTLYMLVGKWQIAWHRGITSHNASLHIGLPRHSLTTAVHFTAVKRFFAASRKPAIAFLWQQISRRSCVVIRLTAATILHNFIHKFRGAFSSVFILVQLNTINVFLSARQSSLAIESAVGLIVMDGMCLTVRHFVCHTLALHDIRTTRAKITKSSPIDRSMTLVFLANKTHPEIRQGSPRAKTSNDNERGSRKVAICSLEDGASPKDRTKVAIDH